MPKMPKPEDMDPDTIAAQRQVFEMVLKAGENYLFCLVQGIYCSAIGGPELPAEVKSNLNSSRKQLLDILQATLASKL
jgi:hypothetical protein